MSRPSLLRISVVLVIASSAVALGLALLKKPKAAEETGSALYGGRVIVQIPGFSSSLNGAIDNSNATLAVLYELHETLLLRDWETTRMVPNVAKAWYTEDIVVLREDAPHIDGEVEVQMYRGTHDTTLDPRRAIYGITADLGDELSVRPGSPGSDLASAINVPHASIERVERDCAYTFEIREGVRWQSSLVYQGEDLTQTQGQELDAHDVYFSWAINGNPGVECDAKRFRFQAIPTCHVVDEQTIRFFGAAQNALAFDGLADTLTLLPAHIYDITNPDCPDYREDATLAQQADHINVNPHNHLWVGVGPYQVTAYEQQYVEATRFLDESGEPAYFDAAERPGYFDTIRWRAIPNAEQALSALVNDEVDFVGRLSAADYFGPTTSNEAFSKEFRKGEFYLGAYTFVCWNLHNPKLADLAVRQALAHAFDMEAYLRDQNQGLGRIMTGPVHPGSDAYPDGARHHAYDPELGVKLLEEAGWYDHNGDGVADKGGVELEIELLYPAGSSTFKVLARAVQDAARAVGIKVTPVSLDFTTLVSRMKERNFEACSLVWHLSLESDPEQIWHSAWGGADLVGSSNNAGVMDEEVDRLVRLIQRETDRDKRMELWNEFHHYIYHEVQPYLFCLNVPTTYAVADEIQGIKHVPMTPGYVLREWYHTDPSVPGVRNSLR